jgi:hypothetical protein
VDWIVALLELPETLKYNRTIGRKAIFEGMDLLPSLTGIDRDACACGEL